MALMAAQEISFGGEWRARMVVTLDDAEAGDILDALEIAAPQAVLMIFGGAAGMESGLKTEIAACFRNAILPIVADRGVLIIDGGTQSGIMEIVGRLGAEETPRPIMLGVAPFGAVTFTGKAQMAEICGFNDVPEAETAGLARLDPNHSHFALTPTGEWGSETETMFRLAAALAGQKAGLRPVAALLFNGGNIARQEALSCVRRGWPLIALQGTGRLADQIAQAKLQPALTPTKQQPLLTPADAELAEIAAGEHLTVSTLADAADALTRALIGNA